MIEYLDFTLTLFFLDPIFLQSSDGGIFGLTGGDKVLGDIFFACQDFLGSILCLVLWQVNQKIFWITKNFLMV